MRLARCSQVLAHRALGLVSKIRLEISPESSGQSLPGSSLTVPDSEVLLSSRPQLLHWGHFGGRWQCRRSSRSSLADDNEAIPADPYWDNVQSGWAKLWISESFGRHSSPFFSSAL